MASKKNNHELSAEDVKRLKSLASKERRARESAEQARLVFVEELQTARPPASVREELAKASGLSAARIVQLTYARKA